MLLLTGTLDTDLSVGHRDPTEKIVQVLIRRQLFRCPEGSRVVEVTSANKGVFWILFSEDLNILSSLRDGMLTDEMFRALPSLVLTLYCFPY